MQQAITKVVMTYRFQPQAMIKALNDLWKTELEKRARLDEAAVAQRACEHRHPAGCGQAYCKSCHEAVVAILTGADAADDADIA